MNQLPAIHFGVDEVPVCGAIVADPMEQTPHLTAVTCRTCLDTLRALKPPVNGLPLDVEHTARLFVSYRTLRLETPCLAVAHRWIHAEKSRFRCSVEDSEGHTLGATHGLLLDVGLRLPEILALYLYNMDQRKSWSATVIVGRTRGGSAPRCVDIQGVAGSDTVTVRGFIGDQDPLTDTEHLSRKIGEYARHLLS